MNLVDITSSWMDYPDSNSLAVEVFFSGCKFNCPSCQNKELQDPSFGKSISVEELLYKIKEEAGKNRTDKVVLVGGDPLNDNNIEGVKELLKMSGSEFYYCVYTGYPIEFIVKNEIKGAEFYKVGVYKQEEHDSSMGKTDNSITFASKNQLLFDKDYNQVSEKNVYHFVEGEDK